MVDENADLNSVVGGFLGVGDKNLTIKKGEDAAAAIDYHGKNYALKLHHSSLRTSRASRLTATASSSHLTT